MRPDSGAQRQKERHRREPVFLAGAVEIPVEDAVGETAQPAEFEIHQQKGEVVEDVDAGQLVGEFEAVEQQGLAVDEADVAQMQVAVAAAHLAGGAARFEQAGRRLHAGEPFCAELADRSRREGPPACAATRQRWLVSTISTNASRRPRPGRGSAAEWKRAMWSASASISRGPSPPEAASASNSCA